MDKVYTENSSHYMPDIQLDHNPNYTYKALRGYAYVLGVFQNDSCIGWINVVNLGYDSVKDWMENEQIKEFNDKCTQLKLSKLKVNVTKKQIVEINAYIQQRNKRELELKSPEMQAKRQAKALKRVSNEIANWRNGGQLTNAVRSLKLKLLRIKGDTVQTSGGAEVPLSDALRLLKLVESGKAKQGESVGHFTLTNVYQDFVKIGCHDIQISEAKAVLDSITPKLSLVS